MPKPSKASPTPTPTPLRFRKGKPRLSDKGKPLGGKPGHRQLLLVAAMHAQGLFTIEHAARVSGTPLGTMYTWIRKNILRVHRVGVKRVFVALADVALLTGPTFDPRA